MTRLCISLAEDSTTALIDRMVDLSPLADMFEIRGDMVRDLDLLTLIRARTRPLLFTCRPRAAGGHFQGDETRRRMVLLEAVKRGFDFVDMEYEHTFLDVAIEKSGNGLVISHHDFEGMPEDLDALLVAMSSRGADVVKIAVTPRSVADVGQLVRFVADNARRSGTPIVPIAMGPLGALTRILAGRWKAPFTFASAAAGSETAPGQLTAETMANVYRARTISPATQVYGILGSDVSRSLSPVLHNAAFDAAGIDAVYVPLQAEALVPFLAALPALDLAGFSVTRPYKIEITPALASMTAAASEAGSVNTVTVDEGRLLGDTTDGVGVLGPLSKHLDVRDKVAVVLGAGGAARAAATALHGAGARVVVLARHAERAARFGTSVGCGYGVLADLPTLAWDVIVNATPVGGRGGTDEGETLVPVHLHRPGSVVFDMVYDPPITRLLREARSSGCAVIGGAEMLLAQAEAQFQVWTGLPAPAAEMKTALTRAIQLLA